VPIAIAGTAATLDKMSRLEICIAFLESLDKFGQLVTANTVGTKT
jgi:hypothetical protein